MKVFLYKQKLLFYQGDRLHWPHCCMKNLYISHRSLYAPTYSFWAIGRMLISLFRVTSSFWYRLQYCDTLCGVSFILLKYPMKNKYFGLTENKLFRFHRIFEKKLGTWRGFERTLWILHREPICPKSTVYWNRSCEININFLNGTFRGLTSLNCLICHLE